jgi:hypothetical protein
MSAAVLGVGQTNAREVIEKTEFIFRSPPEEASGGKPRVLIETKGDSMKQ